VTRYAAFVAASVMLILLGASTADALPRYSATYGQRCALCHVEPTGGGLRTTYASMALVPEELSFLQMDAEQTARIRPDLSPAVTVGLDIRNLVVQGENDDDRERSGQFAMQADVHLGLQMDDRMAAYVRTGRGGVREYAGLAYVLPAGGYLKAGRFTPDFGWRWADHRTATRMYLLDANGSRTPDTLVDTGMEAGFHGQWWEATGSLLQGGAANGDSYAARLAVRRSLGPVNVALGSSIIRRQGADGHVRAWGGFGYVAAGPAAWVFEVDETGDGSREGVVMSQELTWRLARGISARGTYSFHDPDRHETTGARTRWGVGLDTLLNPFFGAQLMANRYDTDAGDLVAAADYWQGELVLHFLY
jgi:hypothetical protein